MVKYSSALIASLLGSSLLGSNADGLRNMMGQGNNVVTVTGKSKSHVQQLIGGNTHWK